jgi:hypothetical protein
VAAVGGEHQRSHLHVNGPLDYSKDYSARWEEKVVRREKNVILEAV